MSGNGGNETLTNRLKETSMKCGADLFGVADANDFSDYTGKRSPFFYVDSARSVIVIGQQINDPMLDLWINSVDGKRVYYLVNEILGNIALEIISALPIQEKRAVLSPYSGLFSKDAAVLANLGTIGKNNLLLTKRFGPRVRLRTIITDAELIKSSNKPESFCDTCPCFCWSACPADAFATGQFDREVCARYSEEHAKRLSDNSILYCRECEITCPVGKESGWSKNGS